MQNTCSKNPQHLAIYWRNNELLTEDLNPPVIYYQQSSCTLNWLSATEIGDVWPKKALVMTRRVLETRRTARRVAEERKHRNFERFSPLVATHTETIELASYKLAARGGEGQEQLWLFWVFRRYCRISIRQNINFFILKVIILETQMVTSRTKLFKNNSFYSTLGSESLSNT